jgi:methionyl-tRNA formyltransferase
VAWTILLNQPAAANLFFLSAEADAGDIIAQRLVETRSDDYAQDLIDRTNVVLEGIARELAPAIRSGALPRRPQDHSQATWYGKRTPEDGRIDWRRPASEIHRLVRACSRPYPGAFSELQGRRLIIWRAAVHDRADHVGTLGQIVRVAPDGAALVQCGEGLLWLTEVTDSAGAALATQLPVGARMGMPAEARLEELDARVRELEQR